VRWAGASPISPTMQKATVGVFRSIAAEPMGRADDQPGHKPRLSARATSVPSPCCVKEPRNPPGIIVSARIMVGFLVP